MIYNPNLQRWEGNEDALAPFSHPNISTTTLALTTASTPTFAPPNQNMHTHDRSRSISHAALSNIQSMSHNLMARTIKVGPIPSPPRPALISQKTMPREIKVDSGMVFDPVKMSWRKAPRKSEGPQPAGTEEDDEEDPFAGMEDLKDNESVAGTGVGGNTVSGIEDSAFVGEEFDLGPSFIKRQQEEEAIWRRKVEGWVGAMRDQGEQRSGGWRWAIRDFAASAAAEAHGR